MVKCGVGDMYGELTVEKRKMGFSKCFSKGSKASVASATDDAAFHSSFFRAVIRPLRQAISG